jgi:ABC-type nitrate/sulfonate/bicarbonate transport system permease component
MLLFKERSFQLLSLVFIVIAWEIAARAVGLGDTYPPPSRVAPDFIELFREGDVYGPLFGTVLRTACGFALAFVAGIAYGILTYASPRFDDYTRGLFNISLFSPTLIVIFLGIVMIGRTFLAVVIIIALCIFAEIGTYMRDAFRSFDGEILAMSSSYKVGTRQRVREMYLPFLIPPMLATSRIGFTLAWKIAVLCEVFGFPEGIGWEIRSSYRVYDMPMLLAWLTVFIVTLLLIEQLIRATERAVVKW